MKSYQIVLASVSCLVLSMCQAQQPDPKPPLGQQPGLPGGENEAKVDDPAAVKASKDAVVLKNTEKKGNYEFVKLLSVKKQVVAGMKYVVVMAVKLDDKEMRVKATLWSQPWVKESPLKILSWETMPAEDQKD